MCVYVYDTVFVPPCKHVPVSVYDIDLCVHMHVCSVSCFLCVLTRACIKLCTHIYMCLGVNE